MDQKLRILSIGAHPADIFDQCGGTMVHHTRRGDWVGCVVLTHGARIHDVVISDSMHKRKEVPDAPELEDLIEERSDVKAQEVRQACKLLGVEDLYFFGADDAILLVTEDAVRRLARLLRKVRPNIVLTHYPKEGDGVSNPHAIAGQIVLHSIHCAAAVDPGDRNPPTKVAQVFFFGTGAAHVPSDVWAASRGIYNDVLIEITDVVDKKLAALDCLVSQGYGGDYARKRIETSDGAFGVYGRVAYAEGFISMEAEVHDYLPLTPKALSKSLRSDHEVMRDHSYRFPVD